MTIVVAGRFFLRHLRGPSPDRRAVRTGCPGRLLPQVTADTVVGTVHASKVVQS